MLKKTIYIVVAVALVSLTVFKLISNKKTTENRVYQYDKDKPIGVQTMTIRPEVSENTFVFSGTFEPNKETKLSADIQGKVNNVLVDLGSSVRKGQTLIQLDNALLKLQLQTIEIQIEGLETDVARLSTLAKAEAVQGMQLEKVELGLKTAQVQKATVLEQISKTTIRAPFNGIVTAKFTEEGAFAGPGMPLLQISETADLRFTVNVPEINLPLFEVGQIYALSADIYPGLDLRGRINMVGSKANMGNSYPVQLTVKNTPDLKIKAGMFGKATVISGSQAQRIVIPAAVMVGTSIQPQVYLVKDETVVLQNIIISERFENKVVVTEGLSEGDKIVTNGFINLFDGAKIMLK